MKIETKPTAYGFLAGAYLWLTMVLLATCGSCGRDAPPTYPRARDEQDSSAVELRVLCLTGSPFEGTFGAEPRGGSGFMISGRRVLTAKHMVACDMPPTIFVQLADGRVFRATVDKTWGERDVARLLLIGDAGAFRAPRVATANVGEPACGVTAVPERGHNCGDVEQVMPDQITFGGMVWHGNSGSALYDLRGNVVGIVTGGLFIGQVPVGTGMAEPMHEEYLN